jgi:hypothetical protein
MTTRARIGIAVAILLVAVSIDAISQSAPADEFASDVYIQQSHGRVAPGTKGQKPTPEATTTPLQGTAGPTAPVTCNAQNASSSQACYTATQQARPATR